MHYRAVIAASALVAMLGAGPALGGATASARLIAASGSQTGQANFKTTGHGVLIEIAAKGLTPGPHAVLIHAQGACNPANGFASAGPIFDFALPRPHGYFAKGGPKPGDLPQQFAAADGSLHATLYTTAISLGDGKRSIFGRSGASIVIHAANDDYQSQPEGRAGARVLCGVIQRSAPPKRAR